MPEAPGAVIPQDLPAPIKDILNQAKLSPEAKATLSIRMAQYTSHVGPLPPADLLASYRAVSEDLPERIIGWADGQFNHRIEMEHLTTIRSESRMDRAQWLSWLTAIVAIVAASVVAVLGGPWMAAAAIVIAGVGGPSAATALAHQVGAPVKPSSEPVPQPRAPMPKRKQRQPRN